ncbi:hypothetical protein [Cellulosimicrobium marinum]|uniref:hypothetical protein n=1 Tax=Cellulosimicrobium marinum TaxID=1638992 RepID=UPI001E513BE0|nr:hypothetical protein [Cellulosimicrobium marinum]MCB7136587.1 hypothetical protein [Cellulosimicrobium marinum]
MSEPAGSPPPLPDALPDPVPDGVPAVVRTRCDACGSQLAFAPGTRHLECVACRGTVPIVHAPGDAVDEHSYDAWLATGAAPVAAVAAQVFACDGCGATTTGTDLSVACGFCGGHLVAGAPVAGVVEPEAVVPFGLAHAQARDAFRGWVRSRWFAPGALKKVGDTESLHGTYVPHWTFDADTTSQYTGERGDAYWVTVKDGENERQERRVSWSWTSGTTVRSFDDVLVPASTQVAEKDLGRLGPWRLEHAQPYRPEYLAGFATARYDVDPPHGLERAKSDMAPAIRSDVEGAIGGDEQRVHSISTAYAAVMFKLVLLPLWVATYVYAGTQWQVMVNANTGEVVGRRPYSAWKITLAVVVGLAVVAALVGWYLSSQAAST